MKSFGIPTVIVAALVVVAHSGTLNRTTSEGALIGKAVEDSSDHKANEHATFAGTLNRTAVKLSLANRAQDTAKLLMEEKIFKDQMKAHLQALVQATTTKKHGGTPVVLQTIVQMLIDLGNKAAAELKFEQQEYDQFMCWCDDTLDKLSQQLKIDDDEVAELSSAILILIAQLSKCKTELTNIIRNIVLVNGELRDAKEQREKEKAAFLKDQASIEATIEAVKSAIKVLKTVQEGGAAFLQSDPMKQFRVRSAMATLQRLLRNPHVSNTISQDDMDALEDFATHPTFGTGQASQKKSLSTIAMRSSLNPFGDYAPQSTRIFGVLQALLDGLEKSLADMKVTEKEREDAYKVLMAAKEKELEALMDQKMEQSILKAKLAKQLADARGDRKDTEKRIVLQKNYTEETTQMCREKARLWSQRTQLRTGEMASYHTAINVLKGEEASTTFSKVSALNRAALVQAGRKSSLLQLDINVDNDRDNASKKLVKHEVFRKLVQLAHQLKSQNLAKVAAKLENPKGGIFNEVMGECDKMIAVLRAEELADVQHRDRCEMAVAANARENEQIQTDQGRVNRAIATLETVKETNENKIINLNMAIGKINGQMSEATQERETEHKIFVEKIPNQEEAISYLKQASYIIEKYFEDVGMALPALVQTGNATGNLTDNRISFVPPPTSFDKKQGQAYEDMEGSGATMVVGLIEQTYTDLEMEIKMDKEREAAAVKEYQDAMKDLEEARANMKKSVIKTNSEIAETETKIAAKQSRKAELVKDLETNEAMEAALSTDCAWVDVSFDNRRADRKKEIQGLEEAKSLLAQHQIDRGYLGMG